MQLGKIKKDYYKAFSQFYNYLNLSIALQEKKEIVFARLPNEH